MTEIIEEYPDHERSCTLLNATGDVEICWKKENDDEMRKIIQEKMDQGVRFFILTPGIFGLGRRRKQVTSFNELDGRVRIDEYNIEKLFSAGKIALFRNTASGRMLDTTGIAQTADEVINNKTVGVRQFVGG